MSNKYEILDPQNIFSLRRWSESAQTPRKPKKAGDTSKSVHYRKYHTSRTCVSATHVLSLPPIPHHSLPLFAPTFPQKIQCKHYLPISPYNTSLQTLSKTFNPLTNVTNCGKMGVLYKQLRSSRWRVVECAVRLYGITRLSCDFFRGILAYWFCYTV